MKKFFLIIAGALLLASATACGTASEETNTQQPVDSRNGANEEQIDLEEEKEKVVEEETTEEDEIVMIPEMKELDVFVEGETEKRIAHLDVSELGYSLYVLDNFQLEAEEPGRDVLLSTFDGSFFVRIEPIGKGADATTLMSTITEHAEGTLHENVDVMLKDVEYSMLEEVITKDGKVSVMHVGKEYNGTLFKFTVFMPLKEVSEGIGPSFWAMLDTIMVE